LNSNSPRLFPGTGEDAALTGRQITARGRNINEHCRYRPGNVDRRLAALWRKAGHEVTTLGRRGEDASDADVVVVAVPGPAISAALGQVTGLAGNNAIDATNALPSRNEAFASLAEEVKSFTGAPVAKSFNLNFAALYDQIAAQRVPPGSFYVAEDDARDITEQLITDAGYDPVPLAGLDNARAVEDLAWLLAAAMNDGVPVFYRLAVPGEL
jgi:predicted dinucleotide-binding enzyme